MVIPRSKEVVTSINNRKEMSFKNQTEARDADEVDILTGKEEMVEVWRRR